jgi:chemotaxis family two-component system sensor kinase Cph1
MENRTSTRAGMRPTNPFLRWTVAIVGAALLVLLVFEAVGFSVFKRIGMPHEFCYVRDGKLVWLHVISDLLIGLAYVSISATLAFLVYKASRDIPFNGVFLAFGLFIVSCGMTHFMEVWVIWEPVYWMSGYVKVVTAAASVATAVALFPLLPKIFALIDAARKSEQRRIEIEQLNQELERFNYTVAHDLRAPLRGITGFAQALSDDCESHLPPRGKHYIERMQSSVARMDALIGGLLKYATVGRLAIQLRPVALDEVLQESTALLESEIRERAAEVVVPGPLPVVLGDATLLQVVFQNLIGNGIKFVAPGVRPTVTVSYVVNEGRVRVTFTDNGVGIPMESRDRVFRIFERFHQKHPGTGIGLAIVHRAVERLRGEIGVEPAPEGTGTRFWIQLPVVEVTQPARLGAAMAAR